MIKVTVDEVERFSAFFGDHNPIHAGAKTVVVPGSLLLGLIGSELRQRLQPGEHLSNLTVRFTAPTMTGEPLRLEHEQGLTPTGQHVAMLRSGDDLLARVHWNTATT